MAIFDTELMGVGAGKALGWTQARMVTEAVDTAVSDTGLDERAIGRIADGRAKPQSRTRLQMVSIAAMILGLSQSAIAREIYWRESYEQLSEEIRDGNIPVILDGFLQLLRDVGEGEDAGGAWNHAMAPFMEADLQWDAMSSGAIAGLGGRSKSDIRQSCAKLFLLAHDRFAAFGRKARAGEFKLAPAVQSLIAARADSMRAIAAEQLYNLALLNEEHGWRLAVDQKNTPLTTALAARLLPSLAEVSAFSTTLKTFLPGSGWRCRTANNEAVISLAIINAIANGLKADGDASDLQTLFEHSVATLLEPRAAERVPFRDLPTFKQLTKNGFAEHQRTVASGARRAISVCRAGVVAAFVALLGLTAVDNLAPQFDAAKVVAVELQSRASAKVLRMAGPGGTRPTVLSAAGPGGTVVTSMQPAMEA